MWSGWRKLGGGCCVVRSLGASGRKSGREGGATMTKRTCVLGMLAALVAVTACDPEPVSTAPAGGGKTFNSKVAFDVYVQEAPDGGACAGAEDEP